MKLHITSDSVLDDICRKEAIKVKMTAVWKEFANFISPLDSSLKPPTTEQKIQELETVLGYDLPLSLRASYLIHNGQYKHSQPTFFPRLFSIEEAITLITVDRATYDARDKYKALFCPVSCEVAVDVLTGNVFSNVRPYGFPSFMHSNWIQYLTVY